MQTCMKRIFSVVLFLALVLSCVPAVAFAAEAENTLNQAIASAKAGEIVKVEADANDVVYDNQGVILDLNGHNVNVTVAEGVTLSAIDSATDDYEGSFGTLTTNGNVAATVKTDDMKSYVAIGENGSYSFHRYYVSIAAISLKPASAALGYRAEFRGDDAVKNAVMEYGYELWANDNAHKTFSRSDALEKTSLTLRLNNLLRVGNDQLNAMGSTATVGGKAYMTLNVGGEQITVSGTEQKTTLRQVIESINANVSSFGEAQLESVRTLCTTYASWMLGWETDAIFGKGEAEGDDDLKVEITVDVTAENNILTEDATLSHGGVSATVPQGTVLENGATKLVLTISQKAASDSDVTKGEGETLIPLDVHIEGISENNTTPIIICLGNVLPKGLNIGNYDLHHVENGKTVAMTRVYTLSELDTHNEFYYDPATGAVTVAMSSFSEIALRSVATGTWENGVDHTWYNADATTLYIYNADQLWSFSQIVGGMAEGIAQDSFSGKTVVLYANIDLSDTEEDGKIFYPIGYYNSEGTYEKSGTAITSGFYTFEGTFDGNGHTISNFYQNTWEMKGDHNWYDATEQNYRDGMGLFGKVYGGTVKNLTVDNFSSDGEIATTGTIAAYADNGAAFENITIFNCNPRVYNIGNGGIVGCVGWYNNETEDTTPVTFTNITVDNTNKISALWGSYDVACGGLVGQYYPTSGQENKTDNKGIHMDNCHITAQIDVNNDVCANYQYYAYRYAGILIGSVRENETIDGREYPKMADLSAENCTVGFGDWNDYYYCELVANSIASYTHDYQFSRLTQVASVDVANMQVTTLEGETVAIPVSGRANYVVVTEKKDDGSFDHATDHATCYHFVDGAVWNHETAGKEDLDGDGEKETLIENNQHIYLEFNNLVTGYGWGVTSKAVGEMDGVTILDKNTAEKFQVYVNAKTTFGSGATIKLSDLFYSHHTVNTATVQAFVSPVGEDSTVTATYVADKEDWKNGTLIFSGKGAAEIIITDYYFCTATKLTVNVTEYTVSFAVPDGTDAIAPEKSGANGANLPTEHSFTKEGVEYTLVGWTEAPVEETGSLPEILPSPYMATKNTLLYPVYSYTENTAGETAWTLVTDVSTLKSGDKVVLVSDGAEKDFVAGDISSAYMTSVTVSINNNSIATLPNNAVILTLGGSADAWTLSNDNAQLLGATAEKKLAWGSGTTTWSISISNGAATIQNGTSNYGRFLYNTSSPRFTTYTSNTSSSMLLPQLYKSTAAGDATPKYGSFFVEACAHNYENGICTICSAIEPSPYVLTDISQITAEKNVIITMTDSEGNTYALYNGNGASDAPTAVAVKFENEKIITSDETILWNIVNNNGELTIYPAGTTESWLYCTNSNDGVRVGTNQNKSFVADYAGTEGNGTYLYNTATSRYLGVYETNSEWRCYTKTGEDQNIKDQVLAFYMQEVSCAHENTVAVEAVDATCGTAGYTAGTWCNDCETYIEGHELIAATGNHNLDNGTVTTAATCGAAGVKTYSCTVCDYTKTEEIPATGEHSFTDGKCTVCGADDPDYEDPSDATYAFVETALSDIKSTDVVVITMTNANGTYAISNNNGTNSAPTAVAVTVNGNQLSGNIAENIKWNIGGSTDAYTFYPNSSTTTWLYCTSTNNGVRVGTNSANTFKVDATSGYLVHNETGRYIGIYNSQDWRCYTSVNSNITGQTLAFYVLKEVDSSEGGESGGTTEPTVVLEITVADFNTGGYAANNTTKTEGDYSYTTNQVTNEQSVMQWKKNEGSISIASNEFVKLELKVTAGTFTVTVGGETVTGTTSNGVTTYDLTGKTGEIKISVGSATGKVDYLKFYK